MVVDVREHYVHELWIGSRGKLFLAQQKSTCIAKFPAIAKTILEASKFTSGQIGIRRNIPTSFVANREDLTSAKNLSIIDILRGCTVRRVNPSFAVTRIIYPARLARSKASSTCS